MMLGAPGNDWVWLFHNMLLPFVNSRNPPGQPGGYRR